MNYSARAIEELKSMRNKGLSFDYEEDYNKFDSIISMLRTGQKFFLPTNGLLLDISVVKDEYNDLIKLPYPVCVLEFNANDYDAGKNPYQVTSELVHPSKFIVILHENEGGEIITNSLFEYEGKFYTSPFESKLDRMDSASNLIDFIPSLTFATLAKNFKEVDKSSVMNDLHLDISVAHQFMIVINTKNVTKDKIFPSEKLNKKRCKNDKEPYDSYWVLDILKEEHERVVNGGSHASPRQHFRRGHLRRLQNGDVVWVRHCLVGNKEQGVVNKSYSIN